MMSTSRELWLHKPRPLKSNEQSGAGEHDKIRLPLLRADTAQYLGRIIGHCEHLLLRARRGQVDLGTPFDLAPDLARFAADEAGSFTQLYPCPRLDSDD